MESDEALVALALEGDRAAVRAMVQRLSPIIQSRVGRMAARGGQRRGEQLQQMVLDLTQDVFVSLFEQGGRALRLWEPARGASLETYVGLIAEHRAASILRSGRRTGALEDPTSDSLIELSAGPQGDTHGRVYARELLSRVLDRLREVLTPKGLLLFELLVVEERSVSSVCASMEMSAEAVYAWRSRLGKASAAALRELEGDGEGSVVRPDAASQEER